MKALFLDIRAGRLDAVLVRLDKKPDLIACTAAAPPKKDDGQSPLQVAIKSGASNRFAVANLLLDRGADVNFQETSSVNTWTAPALHDAIRAAVFSSLCFADEPNVAEPARNLLQRMLELGADVHALDSAGNDAFTRFWLDSGQLRAPLPHAHRDDAALGLVGRLLIKQGANPDRIDARYGKPVRVMREEPWLEPLLFANDTVSLPVRHQVPAPSSARRRIWKRG